MVVIASPMREDDHGDGDGAEGVDLGEEGGLVYGVRVDHPGMGSVGKKVVPAAVGEVGSCQWSVSGQLSVVRRIGNAVNRQSSIVRKGAASRDVRCLSAPFFCES